MRTISRILVILFILGTIGVSGWYLTRLKPVVVTLHTIGKGRVESIVSNTRVGTVKACRRAYLAPMAGGQVATLNVREGDEVQTGQIMLEIWNDDLKAEVQLSEAEAKATRARAREACASAAGAEREAARLRRLVKDRLVSEEDADIAETQAEAKQAGCEAANASSLVSNARVQVARAALERTLVRAPFTGTVAEVNAELGGYVTPSPPGIQTLPAIDLLDVSCLYVSAPIDEVDAPMLKTGMQACVSLDAFPERQCNGIVRRVAPYVLDTEKQARTVEVEVELHNSVDFKGLLPGYSADIEIALDAHDNVLRVPTEAVLEGDRVFIYDATTGRIAERKFMSGLRNWNFTEVLSGLTVGERIVLSVGREGVEAGALVEPENSMSTEL